MNKYGYFKVQVSPGVFGHVTVAMSRPRKDVEPQTHVAAFAFCSPKDSFNKKTGRKNAEVSLLEGRSKVSFEYHGKIHGAFEKALDVLMLSEKVPTWLSKSYKLGTILYGLSSKKIKQSAILVNDNNLLWNEVIDGKMYFFSRRK